MLSLRARNEHRWADNQVHTPKFLMSSDVLRRNTASPFVENDRIARLFVGVKFAFGMRKEIRAIDAKNKHKKQLCIQPRRGNLIIGKAGDGGGKGLLELHWPISPRRH